jgi:hypothetical protein
MLISLGVLNMATFGSRSATLLSRQPHSARQLLRLSVSAEPAGGFGLTLGLMANVNGTLAVSVNGYAAFTVAKIFATLKTVTIIRLATNFRYGLCILISCISSVFIISRRAASSINR